MSELLEFSLKQASDKLAAGDITAVELTEAYLSAIERTTELNMYVTLDQEKTIEQAKQSDARRLQSSQVSVLEGIPIGIKDLFCTQDIRTTAASEILGEFCPAYESTVTERLWQAGAVQLGKLNMDEFAMGSANSFSRFGQCYNPWRAIDKPDQKLVPGGSSGASAAAIASRTALATLGTDTGGSVRQPASFCGIVGVKPTYGRCSRWGVIAFASSLDQPGVFARNVEDCGMVLETVMGYDSKDSTSSQEAVPQLDQAIYQSMKGKIIGIPNQYTMDGMPEEITKIWQQGQEWLKDGGAKIIPIDLPHTKYALPAYYIIANAEASSNLARYDGVRYGLRIEGDGLDELYQNTRGKGFGEEVRRRILVGTYVLSAGYYDAYYIKGQKVRARIASDFDTAFQQCDALLTPVAPSAAFAVGEKMDDPIAMYLNDVFTVPASLAGLPGISIPAGLSQSGLPLGLQVLAKPFDEMTLFSVAHALEKSANFTASAAIKA